MMMVNRLSMIMMIEMTKMMKRSIKVLMRVMMMIEMMKMVKRLMVMITMRG